MKITTTSTARKGRIAFEIDSILSPETEDATKRTSPMGGVARPTVRLTLIMMAKCTGCTPRFMKIGPSIGARIIIAGPASRNIPTKNSSRLIKKSKIRGFSERVRIHSARISGAWDRLTTVLKAIAAPTSNNTTEDVIAASVSTFGKSRIPIDLRMKRLIINE